LRVAIETMLEFTARHGIVTAAEHLPMSRLDEDHERLKAFKGRCRIVIDTEFRPESRTASAAADGRHLRRHDRSGTLLMTWEFWFSE